MASRNISLTPRAEDTRDAYPVLMSIQFSLFEIKQHFTGSMDEIKAQFAVADGLKADENHKSFQIPMEKVENAIAALESNDWFFEYLNKRFSRDVFLSCESMRDQLNLIGIPFNKAMEKAFPSRNEQEAIRIGKETIAMLFQRRNEIAHQNDRSHASAEQTDITKEFVEDYIAKIESIVNAIQAIAEETDKL